MRKVRHLAARALLLAGIVAAFWVALAYLVLPFVLRHHEHQRALAAAGMVTRTAQGLPGDPLNVGIVGTRDELARLMHAAGWFPADPVTLRTGVEIVGSVALDRRYADAPISPLFYDGRRQDLGYEKPVGVSADKRQHVRFWLAVPSGAEGRPVWLGAASFDAHVGFSRYTGAVTHVISPDIDAMRDALAADLAATGRIAATYEITGIGPTLFGRNGEGDPYHTDGEIRFSVIAPEGQVGTDPPPALPNPPLVDLKNALWPAVAAALPGTDRGPAD